MQLTPELTQDGSRDWLFQATPLVSAKVLKRMLTTAIFFNLSTQTHIGTSTFTQATIELHNRRKITKGQRKKSLPQREDLMSHLTPQPDISVAQCDTSFSSQANLRPASSPRK